MKILIRENVTICMVMLWVGFIAPVANAQNFASTSSTTSLGKPEAVKTEEEDTLSEEQLQAIAATQKPSNAQPQSPVSDQALAGVPTDDISTYTLGKADVIQVNVLRHSEVSGQFIINSEGKIQYTFLGDVLVNGLTKEQVKEKLTKLLSTYIVSPEVTVTIVGYNSKIVFVVGEVGRPGKIYMQGDTITVREALVEAGLPLITASPKRGKLITPSNDGKAKHKDVNVQALLYEGDLRENLVMNPGDTLYIPATGLTKVMRALSPVTTPISAAAGAGRTVAATGF